MLGARTLAVLAVTTALPAFALGAETVSQSRAAEYVGQEVTIEGRVIEAHESPLATVLAFAPGFAGFTAKILAADRERFPRDIAARAKDQVVRVTGVVTSYRGQPEMTLAEPAQLVLLPVVGASAAAVTPAATVTGATPAPTPTGGGEEMQRLLDDLAARVETLESRVEALEEAPLRPEVDGPLVGVQPAPAPLSVGSTGAEVRRVLGDPLQVGGQRGGTVLWSYGEGRSVTFDRTGRVVAWTGF